jgi:2-oxoglutarate ferredoxin oxidoreductase subunit alpha
MASASFDFSLSTGGAARQGIATPGNILARMFAARGLRLNAYNAYQSIVRGGHIFLTLRISDQKIHSHGDQINLLVCLNQDTMDRHLGLIGPGGRVIFDSDTVTPGTAGEGVQLCAMPVAELSGGSRNKVIQNTISLGVIVHLLGLDFDILDQSLTAQLQRKGQDVVDENVGAARAGFDYAAANFEAYADPLPNGSKPLALWTGNAALAMGGAAAGVKFYCAYPMSPSTGVLHWMANNARDLDIMVRQGEDEIAVANMVIGAAHTGARAMCATSGGGFALMTEAIGAAAMMEIPSVFINVQRAGPSTGVPTKTEQGDLWQALGASQGDFERFIVAPRDALDAFNTIPEIFNLCDRYQCPGIVITDLLISEGTFSVDPDDIDMQPEIDRGELITEGAANGEYLRYLDTESGVSPRAIPGTEGFVHVVATDEHDQDGVLISDEFTNPHKRRQSVEKRHPDWLGLDLRRHQGRNGAAARAGRQRQPSGGQMDRPAARRDDHRRGRERQTHDHRREQLFRTILQISAQCYRARYRRPHPQVRRRTVHAAPYRRWRRGTACRQGRHFGSGAGNHGLRRLQKWIHSKPIIW